MIGAKSFVSPKKLKIYLTKYNETAKMTPKTR